MSTRIDLPVSVQCGGEEWWRGAGGPGCGAWFELSARADYSRRKEGRDPVCYDCRFPPVIVVTDQLVEWWRRQGFTPALAREICEDWPAGIRGVLDPSDGGFTDVGFAAMMSA